MTNDSAPLMKRAVKRCLERLGLLDVSREIVYWTTRFDPYTANPRRRMVRFYSRFVSRGDLCFDIGANIGDRTALFLELGAKVISVEPQKICVEKLRERYRNDRRVTIVDKGLSNREGQAELSLCDEAPILSTLSERWKNEGRFTKTYQWNRTEKIELATLDRLIGTYGMPAFCKIDVEGHEQAVLEGLSRPLPCVSFEFTRELADEAERCLDRLLGLGPYEFNFSLGEPMDPIRRDWTDAKALLCELKRIPNDLVWGDIYARLKSR